MEENNLVKKIQVVLISFMLLLVIIFFQGQPEKKNNNGLGEQKEESDADRIAAAVERSIAAALVPRYYLEESRGVSALKEKYEGQIIIDRSWGDEIGKFIFEPEQHNTPTFIYVTEGESIYICETHELYDKARIQVFNSHGNFQYAIAPSRDDIYNIDIHGNIYYLAYSTITKCDRQNQPVKEYSIDIPDRGVQKINTDSRGNVYAVTTNKCYQVGNWYRSYSESEQIASELEAEFLGRDDRFYSVTQHPKRIEVFNNKRELQKVMLFPKNPTMLFLDADKSGNLYFRSSYKNKNGQELDEVLKFDPEGRFLSRVIFPSPDTPEDGLIAIAQSGNIYCLTDKYSDHHRGAKLEGFVKVVRFTHPGYEKYF